MYKASICSNLHGYSARATALESQHFLIAEATIPPLLPLLLTQLIFWPFIVLSAPRLKWIASHLVAFTIGLTHTESEMD